MNPINVFELFASLTLKTDDYDKGLDDAKGKAEGWGGTLKSAAKVGAAALATATAAVTAFAASSVKVGMGFDSSMSQVAATMGFTVDELNTAGSEADNTFAMLSEFAQQMGSTTAFSASQAADALNYMALAGYDAETSMSMLPNVLNLAAAGGIELAAASDMVTDASSALGLSLEETAELVDKMATASSNSNTSVAQLGDAILTVGGTAKNLAGGTTELSTALGILADNGIKGAEGGTALRNIILALSVPTNTAAKEMAALGLETYDAAGNLRPLEDIFLDLNDTLSTMTQGEQTEVLNSLFNKVDLKSANALLATTADRWDDLSDAIDKADGSAQAMAEVQLDNLAGDITLFQSALEGAQIAISDGLTPDLRKFVQFGSSAISTLTTAFKEGGLSGAMRSLGSVISDGLAMIMSELPMFIDAGVQLISSLGQGVIQNLPLMVDAALQIIVSLANGIADSLPELIPTIVDVVLQIVDTLTDPGTLSALIDASIAIILALADGLIEALPELIARAPEIVMNLVNAIIQNAPKLLKAALELVLNLAKGIADNLPMIFQKGIELVQQLLTAIGEKMVDIYNKGKEILDNVINGIREKFSDLVTAGKNIIDSVKSGVQSTISDAVNWGKDLISNFINGIKQKWNDLKSSVSGIASTISSYLHFSEPDVGPLKDFHTYAPDMMKLFAQGIRDNEHLVTDQIDKSFDFGTRTIDFASSGIGMSSAAMVNGITGAAAQGVQSGPMTINLMFPDGTLIARYLLNDLINVARANGTPIANAV